jgi:hypothetical protein
MSRWVERWPVSSFSSPDKEYTVAVDENGNYGCSCWRWKRTRRDCKHIDYVKQRLENEKRDRETRRKEMLVQAGIKGWKTVPRDEPPPGSPRAVHAAGTVRRFMLDE